MREPRPWLVEEPDSHGARLTELTAQVTPRPVDPGTWRDVQAARARRPNAWRTALVFCCSCAVGAIVVVGLRGKAAGELEVSASDAVWTLEGRTVRLTSGRLTVQQRSSDQAFQIVTPHVAIEGGRCRVAAEVSVDSSVVLVEEGEVVARSAQGRRRLLAGQSSTWPPTPEIPSRLEPGAASSACAHAEGPVLACLEQQALGEGLTAQAALYELGKLHGREGYPKEAIAAFEESLRRFPGGVMDPEVRLGLLVQLTRARRFSEAHTVAVDFEQRFPDDPRREDVARIKADLERVR
jgi:hypothetical protein